MQPGDVLSYLEMCAAEGTSLQRGMNYRLGPDYSVILMSTRPGAPYEDRVEDEGKTLIYEGHNVPRSKDQPDPETVDQELFSKSGAETQNGLFYRAAEEARNGNRLPERVRVYEKVRQGIWVYNGIFHLRDAWMEASKGRQVCKFKLALVPQEDAATPARPVELEHTRMIPTEVKLEVWKRDGGKCAKCGATDNLHFDHIIPYSKGGSSLTAQNVQLLCARHNLEKSDRVE